MEDVGQRHLTERAKKNQEAEWEKNKQSTVKQYLQKKSLLQYIAAGMKQNLQATIFFIKKNGLLISTTTNKGENRK